MRRRAHPDTLLPMQSTEEPRPAQQSNLGPRLGLEIGMALDPSPAADLDARDEPRSGLRARLPGETPPEARIENTPLPWWEQPPFSGATHFSESGSLSTATAETAPPELAAAKPAAPELAAAEDFDTQNLACETPAHETLAHETFASLLSALAAPEPDAGEPAAGQAAGQAAEHVLEQALDESDALSYEGALRRGSRLSPQLGPEAAPESARTKADFAPAQEAAATGARGQSFRFSTPGTDAEKRLSSVTLRLNRAECAQLKQRAAEAGLTLSAYVRACVFEAETLRAQVKQALRELREEAPPRKPPVPEPVVPAELSQNSQRPWWQLRPSVKNFSAQA